MCRNVEHLDGYGNFPVPIIGMTEEVSKFCLRGDFLVSLLGPVDIHRRHSKKLGPALKYQSPISPSTMLTIWSERTWKL